MEDQLWPATAAEDTSRVESPLPSVVTYEEPHASTLLHVQCSEMSSTFLSTTDSELNL